MPSATAMFKVFTLTVTFALSMLSPMVSASTVTVPDSTVSFDMPDDFTPLTKDEIGKKWLRAAVPPSFAVGNAKRTTTIAYDIKNQVVADADLEAGLQVFEHMFNRLVAGIVWKKKEIAVIQEKRWIHLEMTSFALDTDIYNILLCTPYQGKLLMFNFNSTKEDFPELETKLRTAISSITLGPN